MKAKKLRHLSGGFTRVELVVVLAVAIVVLPLAVGALRAAGEEGRIAKCLGNVGTLMRASQMYLADYSDNYPWRAASGGIYSWAYGGKTTDEYWETAYGGVFYLRGVDRPLNEYVLGAEPQPDLVEGTTVVTRTPMPAFECPSDSVSHQRSFGGGEPPLMSSYDDVGTSYQLNFTALSEAMISDPNVGMGFTGLGRALAREGRLGLAESLLWLDEDPLDFAFYQNTLQEGQHGRVGWHSAGYFDGHADYRFFDSRGFCSPGWAVINTNWIWDAGEPMPPVYYRPGSGKDCTPRD